MRIHYFSGSTLPSRKANAVHVMKMCSAFSQACAHEVTLFGKSGGQPADEVFPFYGVDESFSLALAPNPGLSIVSGVFRVCHALAVSRLRGGADIVYGRDLWSVYLAALTGSRVIFEAHQIPETRSEKRIFQRLAEHRNCLGLVVISEGLRHDMLTFLPFADPRKILVAHDGADMPEDRPFYPVPGWPGRKKNVQVGYTGSLGEGRGIETIIRLAQRLPEMDFHVIGGEPADLVRWKDRCGGMFNLHWHGHVEHARLRDYFMLLDILLAPYQRSIHIGTGADISRWISPMKLFEYMAAGRPVICSDIPVLREILQNGRNALLVPPDDVAAWSDALCQVAADPSLRRILAARALSDLANSYTWDIRAQAVTGFITKALSSGSGIGGKQV